MGLTSTLHYNVSMKCTVVKNIEEFDPFNKVVSRFVEEKMRVII